MTAPLNISFDDLSIWLLDNSFEFSCLYTPQQPYFLSNVWLWSADEYVFIFLEWKSIFNFPHSRNLQ